MFISFAPIASDIKFFLNLHMFGQTYSSSSPSSFSFRRLTSTFFIISFGSFRPFQCCWYFRRWQTDASVSDLWRENSHNSRHLENLFYAPFVRAIKRTAMESNEETAKKRRKILETGIVCSLLRTLTLSAADDEMKNCTATHISCLHRFNAQWFVTVLVSCRRYDRIFYCFVFFECTAMDEIKDATDCCNRSRSSRLTAFMLCAIVLLGWERERERECSERRTTMAQNKWFGLSKCE